jgi:protein TonB
MSYQALLFCPDEKTARTVTQVLSELDFEVHACAETFGAVKKLMGGHFDAVVVDCDHEQNATLLFKSARNSASNQASLAVAVVEGQAGVAKAFRIGANLVLTKPINIEQAKGTLRVARGLLRKGEPGKTTPAATIPQPEVPASPAQPSNAAPAKPAAPPLKPAMSTPPAPAFEKPAARPAWPAPTARPVAAAHSTPQEEEIPEISAEDILETPEYPAKIAAPTPAPSLAAPKLPPSGLPAARGFPKAPPIRPSATSGSGAASAPAPAREMQPPAITEAPSKTAADALFEQPHSEPRTESPSAAPVPSFTFGGANVPEASAGSKKVPIALLVIALVAAAGYFGGTYYQSHSGTLPSVSKPAPSAQPQPANPQPAAPKATIAPAPATQPPSPAVPSASADTDATVATKPSPSAAPAATKPAASQPAPLVVKSGTAPAGHATVSAPEVSAPSIIGMAAGSSEQPPNLGSNSGVTARPLLESLHISQGVSQGLLIKKVSPSYPKAALSMRMEGNVELMATISKTGGISRVKVLSGDPLLARSASDAVKQWKYKPYLLNGEPVEIQTEVTVKFTLPQ